MSLKKLIEKYRSGNYTAEDLRQLQSLLKQDDNQELEAFLDEDWQSFKVEAATAAPSQKIWSRLETSIQEPAAPTTPRRALFRRIGLRAAAAAAVILLLSLAWILLQQSGEPQWQVAHNQSFRPQEIALDDGTVIWLNADSKIEYQQPFPSDIRQVKLEGEAFFEVAKNPNRPFIAQTGLIQTRVLGTAFNIRAYAQDSTIQIALKEGKVAVDQVSTKGDTIEATTLLPGEQIAFDKQDSTFKKERFEADLPYAWKDNIVYFNEDDIRTVIKKLSRIYDVRFTIEESSKIESLLVYRLNTERDQLSDVLKDISTITDYRFEKVNEGYYVVKPK